MVRRTFGVFLALLCLIGSPDISQGQSSAQQESGFQLRQNYPNPFNPETTIPFTLNEDLFEDGGSVTVTMRIYNLIQQPQADPIALGHPQGEVPLVDLVYTRPGDYEAHWDGKTIDGRQVSSGHYFVQLIVDGQSKIMKMFVDK